MALPASGAISLNQVNVELGNSGTANINMNSAAVRGLFGIASGAISMSDGYGKSSETVLTNEGTINGQANRKQITVSNFISAGGTLVVPSGFWVWSDDRAVAAIIIDVACTLRNEGKIIGKGGSGGSGTASIGGDAIKINSGVSGVTIQNNSGSYIAGGGGGGTSQGGGGAGGGNGSQPTSGSGAPYDGGFGGVLNGTGERGAIGYPNAGAQAGKGYGGGAGGGGGATAYIAPYGYPANGGGGGRILPGSGGAGGAASGSAGGAGGSAGNAGGNGTPGSLTGAEGGGGGWGARGGNNSSGSQGAVGGKAVNDSGVSYTLSNSGTIYGAT